MLGSATDHNGEASFLWSRGFWLSYGMRRHAMSLRGALNGPSLSKMCPAIVAELGVPIASCAFHLFWWLIYGNDLCGTRAKQDSQNAL